MLKDTRANKVFLIAVVCLLALFFSLAKGWDYQNLRQRSEQTVAFATTDSLKVSTISSDIIIEVDPKAKQANISVGGHDKGGLSVSKDGSTLSVSLNPQSIWFFNFFTSQPASVIITLPQAELANLTASTTSGDIQVLQALQASEISLKSISGGIDFLNLDVKGTLTATSVTGNITGSQVKSNETVQLTTTSGRVEVQDIKAKDVKLKSVSGNIEGAVMLSQNGSLVGSGTSGRIDLDLKRSQDLDLDASSLSGKIIFNTKEQSLKSATLQTGKANMSVKLTSVSGEIKIQY